MEIARSRKGISVSQRKYTLDLLEETGLLGCKPASVPMEPGIKFRTESEDEQVDKGRYQRLVGKLIYLAHTRPDIGFAVGMVSRFMNAPTTRHMKVVFQILHYLKKNPGYGLLFKKTGERGVNIYTDADWGGFCVDGRSTSGYCTFVWGNLVTWRSKKQSVVARSSAEAEFRAMCQGICEGICILSISSVFYSRVTEIISSNPLQIWDKQSRWQVVKALGYYFELLSKWAY
ncbi:unnamed protein product [Lactuca virosa]|uniref:Reverse transcriptase Ty1/copia-type domain-containing protein n=1 Tax=Lactuca virosa TaxID=75947 RepID=A0AAU9NJ19_9ASTR|nr:unnamed protein product [Lactuca virosa]